MRPADEIIEFPIVKLGDSAVIGVNTRERTEKQRPRLVYERFPLFGLPTSTRDSRTIDYRSISEGAHLETEATDSAHHSLSLS